MRDLAAQAGVALATVYRRFSCKEDILAAALDYQVGLLNEGIRGATIPGETGEERLCWFFEMATHTLGERPKLAAAMLRTVASGVPDLAERVTRYHGMMTEIILVVYRGGEDGPPSDQERLLAELLQNVWFAGLVGWTGGMHDIDTAVAQVCGAAHLLLIGLEHA